MRNHRLYTEITTGQFTLPVVILSSVCLWILFYFLNPESVSTTPSPFFAELQASFSGIPKGLFLLAGGVLQLTIVYFLIGLNNTFSLIRVRTTLQASLFLLLSATYPILQLEPTYFLLALLYLCSLFFLFKSYQQQGTGALFYAFLFLSLGSIFFPALTFLSPFWFIGAYLFQSLHPRSFFAALLGWLFPYWLLFGHAFYHHRMELFYRPIMELGTFGECWAIGQWNSSETGALGLLLLLFIVSASHAIATGYQDKIRIQSFLSFLTLLTIGCFIFLMVQPQYYPYLLPIIVLNTSLLTAHFLTLTRQRATVLLLTFTLLGILFLISFNIWTRL
ncbi:MAG: hypothetical protein EOM31_07705 [Bacteroidia bacterium]|nr:hypothetical protein [Bacteroidia bacterium]